ncbi:MAG TPA: 3-deoxy-D-manno-octulosonic acid transferase [Bacteroidales bacterium]|nr:3-deoxy-D-manno-octulosonic acid transferase [Bacteroidales bacterium]
MRLLYSFTIYLYGILASIVGRFSSKAKQWVTGRRNLFLLMRNANHHSAPCLWFHCASLGEFEQGRPVMEAFRTAFPKFKILLTFFSPSGYNIRKNYQGADWVFYLPLDTQSNAKRFLDIWNPRLAIFVKYEYWYNFLYALQNRKIPTLVVSAHFRKDQHFFQSYGGWFRKHLKGIHYFFVQNQSSMDLLNSIGIRHAMVAGDTRFDRVAAIADQKLHVNEFPEFSDDTPILVAGSTWPADEEILLPIINDPAINLRFIIAPHEISPTHIRVLEKQIVGSVQILSKMVAGEKISSRVIIVDRIGLLSRLYRLGTLAYIGGGFGKGIHNILEAATFGLPVFFGPKHQQFAEAIELVKLQGAFPVASAAEFKEKVTELLQQTTVLQKTSNVCRAYVKANTGATQSIIEYAKNLLD